MTIYDSSAVNTSMLPINEYVLTNCFNLLQDENGQNVYWLETKEHDGFVLIWPDGDSFHTYRHPEDWFNV